VFDGSNITIVGDPMGGSDRSNVAFQVAWSWVGATDSAPILHNSAGDQNFFKFDADDGAIGTEQEDSFWVADTPAGASFVEIEGETYTGQVVNENSCGLDILPGWASSGGISHVEMANHSVQTTNNFTWSTGGGTGEVTLAVALDGITASAGDGAKYGRLVFKGKAGSGNTVAVDIDVILDTTGPVLNLTLVPA